MTMRSKPVETLKVPQLDGETEPPQEPIHAHGDELLANIETDPDDLTRLRLIAALQGVLG